MLHAVVAVAVAAAGEARYGYAGRFRRQAVPAQARERFPEVGVNLRGAAGGR